MTLLARTLLKELNLGAGLMSSTFHPMKRFLRQKQWVKSNENPDFILITTIIHIYFQLILATFKMK